MEVTRAGEAVGRKQREDMKRERTETKESEGRHERKISGSIENRVAKKKKYMKKRKLEYM